MNDTIQSLFLTSLTAPQLRDLFRDEIESYFKKNPVNRQPAINDEDLILDIDQAAAYIKLSIPSIYRLTGTGDLPVIKTGKKLLFSKKDLTAWLMKGRKPTLSTIIKASKEQVEPVTS